MFLRDLLQGAMGLQGNMPRQEDSVTPMDALQSTVSPQGVAANGMAAQHTAPASGILRNLLAMRGFGGQGGQAVPGNGLQGNGQINMPQNFSLPQEDSFTASDYAQGSPSHNNGQVSLHGAFYNGGDLNGADVNQRHGGTIRF